jgi:hypothetical protein
MVTPRALKDPNATLRKQEDLMATPRRTTTKNEPFQAPEAMPSPEYKNIMKPHQQCNTTPNTKNELFQAQKSSQEERIKKRKTHK